MKWTSSFKLLGINFFVLFLLLVLIESVCYAGRYFLNEEKLPYLWGTVVPLEIEDLNDHCQRMKTHPFYGHTHDHRDSCKIKGGIADGPFVDYNVSGTKIDKHILTLGGSTTDGFYQHISNGETYPYLMHQNLKKQNSGWSVINGGVGAYNSTKELLKLLIDGSLIDKNIKIITSLTGINDLNDYAGSKHNTQYYPYFDTTQLSMFHKERWIIKNANPIRYLPNTISGINYIARKILPNTNKSTDLILPSLVKAPTKIKNHIELWEYNLQMMKVISNAMGAEFYAFLQPTMGANDVQLSAPIGTNDSVLLKKLKEKVSYLKNLKDVYSKFRKVCSRLDYCYDISHKAIPSGNSYNDPRHHTGSGNAVIASEILRIIKVK